MGSTRPNPTHVGWVGLGWTYVMGWVGLNFFLTHHGGFGQKISLTRPIHTPRLNHDAENIRFMSPIREVRNNVVTSPLCDLEKIRAMNMFYEVKSIEPNPKNIRIFR